MKDPAHLSEIAAPEHPPHTDDPAWVNAIAVLSRGLNRMAALLAAGLLVLMTALILVEIVMRMFSRSTFMTDVLVGYGVAAITFLAAAWALEDGAMIRVTVLTDRMSQPLRWVCEAFTLVSVGAISAFLISHQWSSVVKLWSRGSVSQHFVPIPLWIPETFFLVGLGLILLQILVRALRLITTGHADERALTL